MLFLIKTGILLVNFKMLFSVMIPGFLSTGLTLFVFCLSLLIKFFNTPPIQFLKAGWLFYFMIFHILMSLIILNQNLPVEYIIAGGSGFIYISIYAWLILLLNKNEILEITSFLLKLIYIALMVFVFEKILPSGEFQKYSNIIQGAKTLTDVAGESYREHIFGLSFERYGSLYFEPLTSAIIITSAYILLQDILRKKTWLIQIVFKIAVAVTFVKSAYLILVLSKISDVTKNKRIFLIFIPISIIMYVALTRIDLADFERIEGLESIGNHLIGFYFGILSGVDKWFLGNGIGTAGYNVYLEALRRDELGPFELLNDMSVLKNGNESALGIIFYQFGLLSSLIAIVIIIFIPVRRALKLKDYTSVGYILSLFIVSMLTESILSSVVLTLIFPMIVFRFRNNSNF